MMRTKRTIALPAAVGAVLATLTWAPSAGAQEGPVISVNLADEIGPQSTLLTGSNVDQWFNNAHGLWDADADAPNPAVTDKVSRAGVAMLRFPGGTSANLYDWKKAVGPTTDRGCQLDARGNGGGGAADSTYGPDEYMEVIETTGATAEIMVPMANETADDAADWVEYMNAEMGTNPRGGVAWADRRAANGHPEPYGVRYWEIGNEPDRGGQNYWRIADDPVKRLDQYTFGGSQEQVDQRLMRGCDRRPVASLGTGEPDQQLQVQYAPVVPGSQTIKVDGVAWRQVPRLVDAGPGEQVYTFDADTGDVEFGGDEHGMAPPDGASITADYINAPKPGFVDFYAEMKKADPSIDICSTWAPIREQIGLGTASFVKLMAESGRADEYDCVLIHPYTNFRQDFGADDWVSAQDGHDEYMLGEKQARQLLAGLQDEVAQYSAGAAYVATSEFGALWFAGGAPHSTYPHWDTSMSHATYMASQWVYFAQRGLPWAEGNTLISEAANGLRAVLGGAPTYVYTADAVAREQLKPVFAAGGTTVTSTVADNPQIAPEQPKPDWGTYSALATSASVGDDGKLRVVVVNRHATEAISAEVVPDGFAHSGSVAVTTVGGGAFTDYNGIENPNDVQIEPSSISVGSGSFSYEFPPASITVLTMRAAD